MPLARKVALAVKRISVAIVASVFSVSLPYLPSGVPLLLAIPQQADAQPKGEGAVFDSTTPLSFAPATIVSAHFLGSEPMITIERRVLGSAPGAIDPKRIFIDWPLGSRSQIGQLSRSLDGGDSFRLLFDLMCAQRSRPTCQTGGGSDTDTDVNPINGRLYFSDQELTQQQSFASSSDHGDTFPPDRQFAITNTAASADREWITAADPSLVSVGTRQVEAFFSYKAAEIGSQYVQGIDHEGLPIPQPAPQLVGAVVRGGPLRVDNSNGPGRGWIYQIFYGAQGVSCPCGVQVATAPARDYQDPLAWRINHVSDDVATIFPWINLDSHGNAYAVWVEGGVVYYSFSPIDDPRNNPQLDGWPGSFWSPQLRVSHPSVGSAIFPEVVAGDPGRIAIAYDGTEEYTGQSALAPPGTPWHTYVAVVTNALAQGDPPIVHTGKVSHRVIHTGSIDCRGGCPGVAADVDSDSSLLDMIDLGFDEDGRVGVTFTDNHSTFAFPPDRPDHLKEVPFAHFAKQIVGPSLLADKPEIDMAVSMNARPDPSGDATWPNTAAGDLLPSLDALGASVSLEGNDLVARVELADGSVAGMQRDLEAYNDVFATTPPAERLQYVVRLMTENEIYHLSLESLADGTRRFFGGLLDDNDDVVNPAGDVVAAGYHTDFPVPGTVDGNALVFRAPVSTLGLDAGSELFGVTAFAMAGPLEADETSVFNVMRTVDATPPFDAVLAPPVVSGLDCAPEQGIRAVGSEHTITCTARDDAGAPLTNAVVSVEVTGAGEGPSADLSCTTAGDGTCSVTHESDAAGLTSYRASLASADSDSTEGRDEVLEPGSSPEPDGTDVTEMIWAEPHSLLLTPDAATNRPGAEHSVTATVTDDAGNPLRGVPVEWDAQGVGDIVTSQSTTDATGRARAVVSSDDRGDQTINASTESCAADGDCAASALAHWGPESCDVFGTDDDDVLRGTPEAEKICAFGGDDVVVGRGGDDVLTGGPGMDRLRGRRGRDILRGGQGRDALFGGRGKDTLRGGRGRDVCNPEGRDQARGCRR